MPPNSPNIYSPADLRYLTTPNALTFGYTGCPHYDYASHPGIDSHHLLGLLKSPDSDIVEAAIDELARRTRCQEVNPADFGVAQTTIQRIADKHKDQTVQAAAQSFLALAPPHPRATSTPLPPSDPEFGGWHNWGLYLRTGNAVCHHYSAGVNPEFGVIGLSGMLTSALSLIRLSRVIDPPKEACTLLLGLHGLSWASFCDDATCKDITSRLVDRLVGATKDLRRVLGQNRVAHLQFRGDSLGGLIGVIAQDRYPGLFDSMILSSAPWELSWSQKLRLYAIDTLGTFTDRFLWSPRAVAPAHPHASALDHASPQPHNVPIGSFRMARSIRQDVGEALHRITVPALLLHGDSDPVTPPSGSLKAAQELTDRGVITSVSILKGVHHRALLEARFLTLHHAVGVFNRSLSIPVSEI